MALKVYPIERSQTESDLVIFLPYTWGGDYHNNRLIQEDLSLITGALVIGAQTPGTGKLYVNRSLRKKLQQGGINKLAGEYANDVKEYLDMLGRPRRLLVGQSGRVALAAHMQLSSSRPFSHVLLRDGVNLMGELTVAQGYRHLTAQPGQGEHGRAYTPTHKNPLHRLQDRLSTLHGLVEVATQGQLLCSEESTNTVLKLATDSTTPLYHVTFARGITGSPRQQAQFNSELEGIRHTSVPRGQTPAPLLAEMVRGNHADLLNTGLLSAHVTRALELQP